MTDYTLLLTDVLNTVYNFLATLPLVYVLPVVGMAILFRLTSGIGSGNLALAIENVNSFFKYQGETGLEKWRIVTKEKPEGDCEDYILGVIRKYCSNWLTFIWVISNPFQFRIWRVLDPNGVPHAVCVCSLGAFDNHRKQIVTVKDYEDRGYDFQFPWILPMPLVKLAIGKF